jgi:hypothetical protein
MRRIVRRAATASTRLFALEGFVNPGQAAPFAKRNFSYIRQLRMSASHGNRRLNPWSAIDLLIMGDMT